MIVLHGKKLLAFSDYRALHGRPETWSDQQRAAMKSILLSWHELSRGDISIICANIREPGMVMTVRGTPHAHFWANLVAIGWAEQLYSPIDPEDFAEEPLAYRLLPDARFQLSHFLVFYDLLNMGACTPESDARQPAPPASEKPRPALFPNVGFAIKARAVLALISIGMAIERAMPH